MSSRSGVNICFIWGSNILSYWKISKSVYICFVFLKLKSVYICFIWGSNIHEDCGCVINTKYGTGNKRDY